MIPFTYEYNLEEDFDSSTEDLLLKEKYLLEAKITVYRLNHSWDFKKVSSYYKDEPVGFCIKAICRECECVIHTGNYVSAPKTCSEYNMSEALK